MRDSGVISARLMPEIQVNSVRLATTVWQVLNILPDARNTSTQLLYRPLVQVSVHNVKLATKLTLFFKEYFGVYCIPNDSVMRICPKGHASKAISVLKESLLQSRAIGALQPRHG